MVDEEFLKKVAEKVLEGESASWRNKKTELSIAVVGQGRIRELNKKYRKKNRATDVLAFLYDDSGLASLDARRSGEIVICLREVKKNAKRFSLIFEKELARVLIHGILHLLGYNHEKSEKEAEKMRKKEEYYLKLLFTNH